MTRVVGVILLCVALIAVTAIFAWLKTAPVPETSRYVGSPSCESCHRDEHRAWRDSQHTKMMRPVTRPGVVVADFAADSAPFGIAEAHWAIGGKWEQQFMGRDANGDETLLPGAWHVAAQSWQTVGWDGWNQPIPKQRCHGCHTVGLDPVSGKFVEPNIGCESCHGPGEWHAKTLGLGAIASLADAEVCGQCHSRGMDTTTGHFHFPVGYRPGGSLEQHFALAQVTDGQNSSDYWGDGRARSRHEEFPDWNNGGHADSLKILQDGYDGRFGPVVEDCLRCHSGDYVLARGPKPDVASARLGVTCSVCHNVHGDLDQPRIGCADCHGGGAFHHDSEPRNARHVPCPPSARVDCVDCHMPKIISIGGAMQFHSHAAGIIEPQHAAKWDMPSSCSQGGCHAELDPVGLQLRFDAFYRGRVSLSSTISLAESVQSAVSK